MSSSRKFYKEKEKFDENGNEQLRKNEPIERMRERLFCVPQLFSVFGYEIENKRYDFQSFLDLSHEFNVGLVLFDTVSNYVIHSDSNKWFMIKINDAHNHALSMSLSYMQEGDQNMVVENLNVGGKNRKQAPPKGKIVQNEVKKKIFYKKKNPNKKPVVEKIQIKETKETPQVEKRKKQKTEQGKIVNLKTKNIRQVTPKEKMRVRCLAQTLQPYKFENPMRLPDGTDGLTGVIRAFQNVLIKPVVCGDTQIVNIIHSALPWCQTLISQTPSSSVAKTFQLANYSLSEQGLRDPFAYGEGKSFIPPVLAQGTSTQKFFIPMHGAACIAADGKCYFRQPGPSLGATGSILDISNPGDSSFAKTHYAIPFIKTSGFPLASDSVQVNMDFDWTGSSTTFVIYINVGYGIVSASTIAYTTGAVSEGAYSLAFNLNANSIGNNIDRMYGLIFQATTATGTPAAINFKKISVKLNTASVANTWSSTTSFLPYSDYVGSIAPPYASFKDAIESSRTIASSILLSDFSVVTQSGGNISAHINSTTYFPSESALGEPEGIASSDNAYVSRSFNGCYIAPLKVTTTEDRVFLQDSTPWNAVQPYANIIITAPAAQQLSFRMQVADIFEVKCPSNQQVIPLGMEPLDQGTLDLLIQQIQTGLITENPTHLQVIWNMMKRYGNLAKAYLPAIQMAANISGNSAAIRASQLASAFMN